MKENVSQHHKEIKSSLIEENDSTGTLKLNLHMMNDK